MAASRRARRRSRRQCRSGPRAVPRHRVHRAGRAEAEDRGAGPEPEAEGGGRVVARARGHQRPPGERQFTRSVDRTGHLSGAHDPGEERRIEPHASEDVVVVRLRGRGPPARARGVAPVRRAVAGQPLSEVVVRQPHGGRGAYRVRLVLGQPCPLGDGERGPGHTAHPLGPRLGAAHLVDEAAGLGRRAHIVPEQRGTYRPAGGVERDEAVLLTADRHCRGPVRRVTALAQRLAQCGPPLLGVALAALPRADRVGCLAARHDRARGGVDDQGLRGLRGAVHPDDEWSIG